MFTVIGAGMAGLLAAAMLREECECIIESSPNLPNNHNALLRFRTSIVGDTLGVSFKKVKMMKAVVPFVGNPIGDAIAYSLKTNGTASLRSSISAHGELEERYIAPANLIEMMDRKAACEKQFNNFFDPANFYGKKVISTIPMTMLANLLGYKFPDNVAFESRSGAVISATVPNADIYATLYFPSRATEYYRASITGNKLIVEFANEHVGAGWDKRKTASYCYSALSHFGFNPMAIDLEDVEYKRQRYAKILPIDERERKRFIMWASDKFGIYSLGRFATWRPGLLMDDVVNDVRVIQQIVSNGSYDHLKR